MGFMDKLRGNKKATLPRGARVVRRRHRRGGGSDTGYWHNSQFFLIDGTLGDSYVYETGSGEVLGTSEARDELSGAGYDTSDYTAPSSYDSGSSSSYDSGSSSSYDSGSSYGGGSSYDSGSSYSSGGSSYDSGSSSSGGSSYDSGSSSSSSDSSW